MNHRHRPVLALAAVVLSFLTACSGKPSTTGTPTPAGASTTTPAADEAPKVPDPLPASVLDGSPCEAALTIAQVTEFIGKPKPAQSRDRETGPVCDWRSIDGVSGSISVGYLTKVTGGLSAVYQNTKPEASQWEPFSLGDYPSVIANLKGTAPAKTGLCGLFVGVRDDLVYSVDMALGDNARNKGVDSCAAAKDVANTVLANLKARR